MFSELFSIETFTRETIVYEKVAVETITCKICTKIIVSTVMFALIMFSSAKVSNVNNSRCNVCITSAKCALFYVHVQIVIPCFLMSYVDWHNDCNTSCINVRKST